MGQAYKINTPHVSAVETDGKVLQLVSYLRQLSSELNYALNALSNESAENNKSEIVSECTEEVKTSTEIINAYYNAIKTKLINEGYISEPD